MARGPHEEDAVDTVDEVTAPTVLDGATSLRAAVGRDLGVSAWLTIDQDRIDAFADATGDHQWIHVDPQRAAAQGPFGSTVAHGYLTQSLTNHLVPQVLQVEGFAMGVNYGTDKVRFPAPVPVGSRVRCRVAIVAVDDVAGGVQVRTRITVELEGSDRPACVVEALSRFLT